MLQFSISSIWKNVISCQHCWWQDDPLGSQCFIDSSLSYPEISVFIVKYNVRFYVKQLKRELCLNWKIAMENMIMNEVAMKLT